MPERQPKRKAFKRACSCFGLGWYLYNLDGTWVDLDERRQPKFTPKLPNWAPPKRSMKQGAQNGHRGSGGPDKSEVLALQVHVGVPGPA
jgi:hypothetical protein